jgi:hypothetical protein
VIRFRCKCSNWLNVQDNMSGESIQCPKCGILLDVPTLDDLANIAEDGTLKVNNPQAPMAHRDGHKRVAPSITNRQDSSDRRQTVEEFLELDNHVDEVNQPTPRAKLLYDPVTGELVEPLAVKPTPPPKPIPKRAASQNSPGKIRTLGYARPGAEGNAPDALPAATFLTMWWRLLVKPANLTVVAIVSFLIPFATFFTLIPGLGLLLLFLLFLPVQFAMIGQLGNVIDETGPLGRDELPTPLREGSFSDDIWLPFVRVVIAFFLAFLPLWVILIAGLRVDFQVELAIYLLCYFPLPALLITSVCSGFWTNLLPQRSLPVMWLAGVSYLWAVFTLFVATHVFLLGYGMVFNILARLFFSALSVGPTPAAQTIFGMPVWAELSFSMPLLILGVWLLHGAGWTMGLIYRRYHSIFPWVMQRHISTRTDTQAKLLEMRRQGTLPTPADRKSVPPASAPTPGPSR